MTEKLNTKKRQILRRVIKYLAIVLGCMIYAVGFQFFMFPNNIVSGGVVGVSMIVNQLSGIPVGVMTIILNVPLFIIAWKHFGLEFLIASLFGTVLSSISVDLMAASSFVATNDPMLGAIIGAVIKGAGMGIVYYVGATLGGVDIVAKLLRQKYHHINFGTIVLIIDIVVVCLYTLIFKHLESAMYSLIGMFVVSKVVDLALYGIDNSCICYIISSKSKELTKEIISGHIHRGVTVLDGEGAYSGEKKQVIMCVIKRVQSAELRRLVRSVDENAFFIVTDAKNVFGNGFERISEVK